MEECQGISKFMKIFRKFFWFAKPIKISLPKPKNDKVTFRWYVLSSKFFLRFITSKQALAWLSSALLSPSLSVFIFWRFPPKASAVLEGWKGRMPGWTSCQLNWVKKLAYANLLLDVMKYLWQKRPRWLLNWSLYLNISWYNL